MTPRQAAAYLNLAVSSLAKWRVEGIGPSYIKLGSAVRYRRTDLDDWIGSKVQSSTSQDHLAQERRS
ncbi:helix-turn-helix transcriptional regulator [Hyphobacterium sp.]|uniref:helix-turn-helix transcriptional regulator n=1 Tax=Hyphobacterium sp. TaxID=2004662 RepID=UPI003B5256FB